MNEILEQILSDFSTRQDIILMGGLGTLTGHDLNYMKLALQMNFPNNKMYQNGMSGAEIMSEFAKANFEKFQLPSVDEYAKKDRI